jgi:N-acetylmuramoyl-L-alanine amidase
MKRLVRATGLSVAALSLAMGWAFMPTQAETDAAPSVARYTEHGTAAPLLNEAVLDSIDAAAAQEASATATAPVVEHAVATIEPVSDEPARPRSLSELVNDHASSEVPDAEMECLAGAIYFESKGEPLAGQLAVAEVIINRAKSGRFPSSYCGVVKQRGQFSFIRGGQFPPIARNSAHWRKAVAIAHIAAKDLADSDASRALFFHARHVSPRWRLTRVAAVGNHIFYR